MRDQVWQAGPAAVAVVLALLLTIGSMPVTSEDGPSDEDLEKAARVPLVIPAAERNRKNPMRPTEESVADGKLYFSSQCTMCHGKDGRGKGDLVERLELRMPDLTVADRQPARTDGELFYILTDGHARMPGQGGRFNDEVKWNIINYVRSLGR